MLCSYRGSHCSQRGPAAEFLQYTSSLDLQCSVPAVYDLDLQCYVPSKGCASSGAAALDDPDPSLLSCAETAHCDKRGEDSMDDTEIMLDQPVSHHEQASVVQLVQTQTIKSQSDNVSTDTINMFVHDQPRINNAVVHELHLESAAPIVHEPVVYELCSVSIVPAQCRLCWHSGSIALFVCESPLSTDEKNGKATTTTEASLLTMTTEADLSKNQQ